jgi:hypothetical protein
MSNEVGEFIELEEALLVEVTPDEMFCEEHQNIMKDKFFFKMFDMPINSAILCWAFITVLQVNFQIKFWLSLASMITFGGLSSVTIFQWLNTSQKTHKPFKFISSKYDAIMYILWLFVAVWFFLVLILLRCEVVPSHLRDFEQRDDEGSTETSYTKFFISAFLLVLSDIMGVLHSMTIFCPSILKTCFKTDKPAAIGNANKIFQVLRIYSNAFNGPATLAFTCLLTDLVSDDLLFYLFFMLIFPNYGVIYLLSKRGNNQDQEDKKARFAGANIFVTLNIVTAIVVLIAFTLWSVENWQHV